VKWSEGLNLVTGRLSLLEDTEIIWSCLYGCFIHHILAHSFGSIFCRCMYGCMFCMLLSNFVNYVFLLLCMSHSVYSVSLCCSVHCLCVNVYGTTATGCQPNCS
jgi:hypothetical protein